MTRIICVNKDKKITTININKIFEFSNIIKLEDISKIEEPNILKNHAFAVSMEFRNQNNSHHKKNQKNNNIASPIYYFDKENTKQNKYNKNNKIQREDGQLIENFIDEDKNIISSLNNDIIYGNLLDTKFFIQENFDELKNKMNKIRKKKNIFNDKIDETKINNNQIMNDLEKIYLKMKKTGTVEISDEEYDDFFILDIIEKAKDMNTYEQLPEVIKYIDRRMKEEKKKKNK